MTLWPEEYEGMRAEARATATAIAEMFGAAASKEAVSTDRDERVRGQREMMKAFEAVSPAGVDQDIAGVPCRVFRPERPARAVYLHFHGGAMILGSPLMNDVANADLSSRFDLAVVSVDYRLAPEHPHPAGSDDCLAVARWVVEHGEAEFGTPRVLIGGESAGGYYAALTTLRVRDELDAIDRVIGANLVFGVYDLSGAPAFRGARPSDVPDILEDGLGEFVNACFVPGLTPDDCKVPEHLAALRRPVRPAARALHRRQRRPPARRQPVHGRALGGVRERHRARGVPRLHPRVQRVPHRAREACQRTHRRVLRAGPGLITMADELDVDAMIARFRERAAAVRDRPLPPVAGAERQRFVDQAQRDFQDFAIIGDATWDFTDGILTLRVDLT